ncbi:site-specific integrase [Streptomyces sp. UH6]|uniref:tyrosine-type recombinase/integrase n=1 Tax=Streptomyces sp. UH6 TaxID=2748379 RepID=UPI0015D4F6C2|nr:site-specific integrase [Streptomyces sp. UH6]NYV73270.1 site-specific integrase [Streptomyces sp. UH6]
MDLRVELMEGRHGIPWLGQVVDTDRVHPPYVMLDATGAEVEPVNAFLRDLALGDCSALTCRSYGFGMLRWFRLLWLLGTEWERATEAEVALLTGWLRSAANPQRRRIRADSPVAGTVNVRTGKSSLGAGYALRTINHALTVISGFYEFHAHQGRGPVVNPVPNSAQRRRALGHRSPLEPTPVVGRARLRQRVPDRPPRSIPDRLWDELFAAMNCDRDRALLEIFVSSGARAEELLGITVANVDWSGQRIYVISKGSRAREAVPVSPQGLFRLALYLDTVGSPAEGEPVWRSRRGRDRPLTYWAMRRVMQRANALLGTNWSLHDLRHTAAYRMANGGKLTLPEVQTIMRHANIQTTSRYLAIRVEELFDRLADHYSAPRPARHYPAGYAAEDIKAVFGG